MPVQYGFPPEAATPGDQSAIVPAVVPAKSLLEILAEKRGGTKDSDMTQLDETKVDSPPPGHNNHEIETPSKGEAPAAKKRPVASRPLPVAAKKLKESKA